MAENSKIEWCDHTFNPWIGCSKVSPLCTNCYAEELMDNRYKRVSWGEGNERSLTSASNWLKPVVWDRQAKSQGKRFKVFCASLADVADIEVDSAWRSRLKTLIRATPNLDWLLLTKRLNNHRLCITVDELKTMFWGDDWPDNVWFGHSVGTQGEADHVLPQLKQVPASVRFLSCEPLLAKVRLDLDGIDWVIVGGESGRNRRPIEAEWVRAIRDQCSTSSTPFFFKQWGGAKPKELGRELDGVIHSECPQPKIAVTC